MTARSNNPDMTTVLYAWPCGRFIEIQSNLRSKKLYRKNQGSNFLGGSFSNRDNMRDPIQFRRKRQPQHLKRWFFLKNRPIHFHINNSNVIIDQLMFLAVDFSPTFLNTGTTDKTFQQSGNEDSFRHILKSLAGMYESSGSQFLEPPLEYIIRTRCLWWIKVCYYLFNHLSSYKNIMKSWTSSTRVNM